MARKTKFDPSIDWEEVRREWRARVVAEYHSAAFTTELLHILIRIGTPYELLLLAHRIVKDELIHAERSFGVFRALGGEDQLLGLQEESLTLPTYSTSLFDQATCTILHTFCLGETFAVPLFRAMFRKTTHSQAKNTLRRIIKDESIHREFGWKVLDYLLERDPKQTQTLALEKLVEFLTEYQQSYGRNFSSEWERVTSKEEAYGLLQKTQYVSIFQKTLSNVIFPRFLRRQIDAKSLWNTQKSRIAATPS